MLVRLIDWWNQLFLFTLKLQILQADFLFIVSKMQVPQNDGIQEFVAECKSRLHKILERLEWTEEGVLKVSIIA